MAHYRFITVVELVLVRRIVKYYRRKLQKDLANPIFGDGRKRSEYYLKRIKRKIKVLIPPSRRNPGPPLPIRDLIREVTGLSFPKPGAGLKTRNKKVRSPSPRTPRTSTPFVNPRTVLYNRPVPGTLTTYGGDGSVIGFVTSNAILEYYTRVDNRDPLFRGRKKPNISTTLNYSKVGGYQRLPYASMSAGQSEPSSRTTIEGHTSGWSGFWNGMGAFASYPPIDTDLDDRCISGLLSKLKDSKINLAQAFAESSQTKRLLVENATALVNSIKAVKRGDMREAARFLGVRTQSRKRKATVDSKVIGRRWLELQYGWMPFLSDVGHAAEQVAQILLREQFHKFTKTEKTQQVSEVVTFVGEDGKMRNHVDITQNYEVKYSVVFKLHCEVSHLAAQTGLTNPALLAWELLPYSFVVDWFVGVGDYLSNLDAAQGLEFVKGTRSSALRENQIVLATPNGGGTTLSPGFYTGTVRASRKDYALTRDKLNTFPSQTLPAVKKKWLTPTHFANAAALLRTGFHVK